MAVIENINVSSPNDGLGDSLRNSQIKANNNFAELNDKKVEKVAGKDLSANNLTDILKTKLDGIEDGAEVNVQSDWSQTDTLADDYIKNKPDLSQYFSAVGGFDYEDLATQTTPLAYTIGLLQLTNDTLGANTSTNLGPYGVTKVWDSTINAFVFGELSLGDEVILRVHIELTTSTANQISGLSLLFGEGTAKEYTLPIDIQIYHRTAGVHDVMKEIHFYLGNEDWRVTPVKLLFNSSANASVLVYGWHPYIIRKSINILDIDEDTYKTFSIIDIEPDSTAITVTEDGVIIGYNSLTNKVNRLVFDTVFSAYLYNYDLLNSIYNFSISWFDKSNGKSFVSFITNFTSSGSHYIIEVEEGIDYTDFAVSDKIEIFITAQKSNNYINDSAGAGVLNQSWSADKLVSEFATIDLQSVTDVGNTTTNQIEVDASALVGVDAIVGINENVGGGNGQAGYSNNGFGVYGDSVDGDGLGGESTNGNGISALSNTGLGARIETIAGSKIASFFTNNVEKAFIDSDGDLTANSFIKDGGLSTEFLKADGSVDTNTYLTGTSGWGLQGNAGTNPATDFIGTTDVKAFKVRVNNAERLEFYDIFNLTIFKADPAIGQQVETRLTNSAGTINFKLEPAGTSRFEMTASTRLITAGQNTLFLNGNLVGINTVAPTDTLHVNGTLRVTGAIKDSSNSAGTSGQGLSSSVTGTSWGWFVSALGTTGTDINLSTNTLNIPTASALNRGALSSADWNTFNNKINLDVNGGIGLPITPISTPIANSIRNDAYNIIYTDVFGVEYKLSNGQPVDKEIPTGLINGVNTVFTMAFAPIVGSEHIYRNGILQESGAGNDYTISGATITYLTAPLTGDKLRVTYRR